MIVNVQMSERTAMHIKKGGCNFRRLLKFFMFSSVCFTYYNLIRPKYRTVKGIINCYYINIPVWNII